MSRHAAYRRTLYRAGEVIACVGRRSASGDAWMARHGLREAGFITAWNPMSKVMPARWNAAAQSRLWRDARRHAVARGEGRLGDWQEEMLLLGAPAATLVRLARRHRQAAIVLLRRGRPAILRYSCCSRASKWAFTWR